MTGRTDTVSSFSGSDPKTRTSPPRMWNAAWRQHRYWVVGTVALVVTGAAVRLTGSGLGCPTWPRCTDASYTTTPAMGINERIISRDSG